MPFFPGKINDSEEKIIRYTKKRECKYRMEDPEGL